MISSPYNLDVRHSSKRGMQWKGYRMQITETCDPDGMMVITNVETTASTDQDWSAVTPIHDNLERKKLLPSEHLADQAYLAADLLVESRNRYGVDLTGPIRPNPSWQTKRVPGRSRSSARARRAARCCSPGDLALDAPSARRGRCRGACGPSEAVFWSQKGAPRCACRTPATSRWPPQAGTLMSGPATQPGLPV